MSSKTAKSQKNRKILLVTLEPVSKTMAGPAIRCLELAKQLAKEFTVTLISPVQIDKEAALDIEELNGVKVLTGLGRSSLYNEAIGHDILVIQSNVLKPFPKLAELGKYLVVDLYDPYLFAVLVQYKDDPIAGTSSYRLMHSVLENHMINADFSMCASEVQRDYWLGRYCAIGRLTPDVYKFDPSLRKLIDVVPFGLSDKTIERTGKGMRNGKFPIGSDDKVLLWGGGIWDWFDPLTVIEAVNLAKEKVPTLRLYFMGWKSPNPKVEVMDMAHRAKSLASDLDIIDKHVFFEDDWIPYNDRVNYLLDADIAVSAHFDLPETRFSFRTRILDCFYAGLPVLSTGGDPLSNEIDQGGAGFALPYLDSQAWACAITKIFEDDELKSRLSKGSLELAKKYSWDKTASALVNFCRDPHHLPSHNKPTMPNIVERARAVYSRGGTDLVLKIKRNNYRFIQVNTLPMPSSEKPSKSNDAENNSPGHSLVKCIDSNVRPYIPPHLLEPNWLEYEYRTALKVLKSTQLVVRPLGKDARVKDIHRIRICLRRWFSIWSVLREDGWETSKYLKKIDKNLRRLYKYLGSIRDWDVNCKLVRRLELPSSVVKSFEKERLKVRKRSFKGLKKFDLEDLLIQMKSYLKARYKKLKVKFIRYQGSREETVFSHFEKFLILNEAVTRELSKEFEVMEDIHNFRLGIKSWRYLLVEFYGVTNLELVACQKHLGKTVDYDRIRIALEESPKSMTNLDYKRSIESVVGKRNALIKDIEYLKGILPFGFRPFWVSQGMMN